MNESEVIEEKDPFIVIPIQMVKCEIVILRSKKLTNLEKFALKFIYKDNSLYNLINAFNVGKHVMNYILAQLFYSELIYLDLNQGQVMLSNKILEHVENNTLDEFINKETSIRKFPVTIVQEKIGGEIFIEDLIKSYLRIPPSVSSEYNNIKASPSETFQDLKDYSLNKYAKCVKTKIHSDFEELEKINFLRTLYRDSLYIPLTKDKRRIIDLDFDIFPKSVQKYWQNAYESQYSISNAEDFITIIENPIVLSNDLLQIGILNTLDNLQLIIEDYKKKELKNNIDRIVEEEIDTLCINLEEFKKRIESVNNVDFYYNNIELTESIIKQIKKAGSYIIICSDQLNQENLQFLKKIIKETKQNNVSLIFIWGRDEDLSKDEQSERSTLFEKELYSGIDRDDKNRIYFTISSNILDVNFLIIDFDKVFYNTSSFMGTNYFEQQTCIPTVYLEGGFAPIDLLQILIDYLPNNFDLKSSLDNYLKKSSKFYFKKLSKERKNLILRLNKAMEMLEYNISNNIFDEIVNLINLVKSYASSLKKFETVTTIYNLELEDILIDIMKEIKNNYFLITDDINDKRIGPIFKSSLVDIPNFSIILLNDNLKENTTLWNLGISKLDALIEDCRNVNYKELEKKINFNSIISGRDIFIYSNYRFLAPLGRQNFNYHSKKVGLIINSCSVIDKIIKFIEILNK